jgi:carbonic anhydrase
MKAHSIERRDLLRHACCGAAGLAFGLSMPHAFAATGIATEMTPDQVLALLKESNQRFVADQSSTARHDGARRLEIAKAQAPIAVLVGCSDSRVSPEILFGRGLGELFIIRNAGNTVDLTAQGSIEYAVAELGVPLILVLGHERCGAVAAALEVVERSITFPGRIGHMVEPIIPAVLKARQVVGAGGNHDELLDAAVHENVRRVAAGLSLSELLTERQRAGRLKIIGARYDLDDGRVNFFHEA